MKRHLKTVSAVVLITVSPTTILARDITPQQQCDSLYTKTITKLAHLCHNTYKDDTHAEKNCIKHGPYEVGTILFYKKACAKAYPTQP